MTISSRFAAHRRRDRLACLLIVALPCGVASAEWETVSDILMGVEANDNPRLGQRTSGLNAAIPEDHTSVRMYTDARVTLANVGQRGDIRLRPRVRLDTYADSVDKELKRDDIYLNGRASYSWSRATVGLRGNINRESILSSETLEAVPTDPDEFVPDPIDVETGELQLLSEHRFKGLLAPYVRFSVSERSDISLEATYLDVSYTGPLIAGRSDFRNATAGLGIGRTIDDRTRAEARLLVGTFDADLTDNQTDWVGVEGTFQRSLSEAWSFYLSTGLQRTEFTYVDPDDPSAGVIDNASADFTVNVGFRKRAQQSTLDLDIQRLLNPNAIGFLTERNQLRVYYERQMSERMTGGVALRYTEVNPIEGPGSGGYGRDYLRADFTFEWAFSPTWFLNLNYAFIDQELSGQRADGSANLFSIGAVYRGLSRTAAAAR